MSGPYWDQAWSVTMGCTPASEGCRSCWARTMHERFSKEPFSEVRILPEALSKPLSRGSRPKKPTTYFVCNTSDLYHPSVPFEFIAAVYGVMAACPQHTFLVLTKRPERRLEFMRWLHHRPGNAPGTELHECQFQAQEAIWEDGHCPRIALGDSFPLDNVWEGITAENQEMANVRIPLLLQTPAAFRWVSLEPCLGGVDMDDIVVQDHGEAHISALHCDVDPEDDQFGGATIDQVIVGGEAGPGARPFDLAWARSLMDQCQAAWVPFYFKQAGSNVESTNLDDKRHIGNMNLPDRFRMILRSRSGKDPSEWPEDLDVQELAWKVA